MNLPYQTPEDPTLDHQVRFVKKHNESEVSVSCNCRGVTSSTGGITYTPMGPSEDIVTARKLYNDPENHVKPFGEADFAKW